jgi:hypothetical protein
MLLSEEVSRATAGPLLPSLTVHDPDSPGASAELPVTVAVRSGGCTVIVSVALLSVSSPSGITPSGSAVTVIDNGPG